MQTRYAKQISTGKIIQSQSGGTDADLETVKQNALNSGYAQDDIEVGWMDADECHEKQAEQDEALKTYKEKRKESYPPMENYLDGIVKGDQGQIDKYVSDCLAVKEKFPK